MHILAGDCHARHAVIEREQEGKPDQENDVEDRGRQHGAPQPAIIVRKTRQEAHPYAGFAGNSSNRGGHAAPPSTRLPSSRSKRVISWRRTMTSSTRPASMCVRRFVGTSEIN